MTASSSAAGELLIVAIGGAEYSLPVSEIECVIALRRSAISAVPFDTGGRVRGIFSHNGRVVALARRVGLTAASDLDGSDALTAVIFRDAHRSFAILIDGARIAPAAAGVAPLSANELFYGDERNDD